MTLLNSIYFNLESKITNFLDSKNWKTKVVIISILVMLASFFNNTSPLKHIPEYFETVFKNNQEYFVYQTVKDRASNFTKNWVYPEGTGINNRTFRLTMPLFVKVFGIRHVSIVLYILQLILGLVFIYLLINFFNQIFEDKIATFYTVIAFTTIYSGSSFFIDIASYFDFFSFFFLFLSIFFRNPILIFIFLSLAFWNDERAFVGSGLVFLWWWFVPQFKENKPFKITFNLQLISIILSWSLYWIIRKFYLTDHLGMHDTYKEGEFWGVFDGSWKVFGFKFFWVYEFWWLAILLSFVILIYKKDYIRFLMIVGALAVMQFLSLTTFDSTRSGSFGLIIIPFSLIILKKYLTDTELKILLFIIAIGCFLHPLATRTTGVGFFLM
jgi:hypothetical protein